MKVLILLTMIVLVSCQTREIGSVASTDKKLVFSDDFERAELGENWVRGSGEGGPGQWTIKDGWVAGDRIKNDPLWYRAALPAKVRVEFDARSRSADGDLKFEIFGDGDRHESGYIVVLGGWKNSLDIVARLDEHGEDRLEQPTMKVEANKVYKIAAERIDSEIRIFVDGRLHMTYADEVPLKGAKHRFFAFNDWMVPVEFDNFRVYELQ